MAQSWLRHSSARPSFTSKRPCKPGRLETRKERANISRPRRSSSSYRRPGLGCAAGWCVVAVIEHPSPPPQHRLSRQLAALIACSPS